MSAEQIVVLGDSHAHCLRLAQAQPDPTFSFKAFGAVKQSIYFHHRVEGKTIKLLEQNWKVRQLPLEESHIGNADVLYVLSLPHNYAPLLRNIEYDRFTIDPANSDRAFMSVAAVNALIHRRNRLGIALAVDMKRIGLNVATVEAPRIFVNKPYEGDPLMSAEICFRYFIETNKALKEAGIPVIHQPARTIDSSGYTKGEYASEADQQHGNTRFYQEVLKDIADWSGF